MEPTSVLEILVYAALLVAAALVAMVLRAEDTPKTPWDRAHLGTHVQTLVYGLISAGVLAYVLDYDPATPGGFVAMLTAAYVGIVGVRALLSREEQNKVQETKV